MARIAAGGKRAAMRVLVTIGTLRKRDSDIAYYRVSRIGRRDCTMAFGALHPDVGAGQLVFGRGMVEAGDIFPFGFRVTALALIT